MRRLVLAAAAALVLVLSSSAAVLAGGGGLEQRWWESPADRAQITLCISGNSATILGAQADPLGTKITGQVTYCGPEAGSVRYFGLEFFSGQIGTSVGYFMSGEIVVGSGDLSVKFSFTGEHFDGVTAMCVSAAPNDRLACKRVSIDGKTGVVSLVPISIDDPAVAVPPGAMYFCNPGEHNIDPTCVTCVP